MRLDARGFTLIEVLFTVAIAALMILGTLAANTSFRKLSETAHQNSVAGQDAHAVIERMRAAAIDGDFPNNVVSEFPDNAIVSDFTTLTNQQVRVSYDNAAADPLAATVTVTWLENGVRSVSKSVRALITQRVPSELNESEEDEEEEEAEDEDDHGEDDHDDDDHDEDDHDDDDHDEDDHDDDDDHGSDHDDH